MKILHIVPTYLPATRYGGPIYSVHGLCKALAAIGHEVHVFTTNVDGDKDSDVPLRKPVDLDGVKIWYFPSKHLRRLYYCPSLLKALNLKLKTFDILHLHSIFLWPTWAAARAARRLKKPYIISPRGMLVKKLARKKNRLIKMLWLHLIERKNIENASAVHFTSSIEEEEAYKFDFKMQTTFVIPNGIDIKSGEVSEGGVSEEIKQLVDRKPFLLFIGRINWKKGLDRLIPALSYIPKANLIIAGNDEENYTPALESLALKHSVRDRIIFTGPVYGSDKMFLIKNASISVLPSYSENFGNTVLEAMSEGCPVAVTPEVGASEIVAMTGAGLVLNGDPDTFGKGINNVLSNKPLLEEMGKKGVSSVSVHYSWPAIANQLGFAYSNLLKSC